MPRGGYREGSGKSKSGRYKGIYCGSTYELCWVIYSIDHKIPFKRFSKKLTNEGISYYPDFLLSDEKTIIEIKGYENKADVLKKKEVAEFYGYDVKILYKEDLTHVFNYVSDTYKTNKYYDLYDNYKPKNVYSCDFCFCEFETNRRKTKETIFCSRKCCGKYRQKQNSLIQGINEKISASLTGRKMKKYTRRYKQIWINNGILNTKIKESDVIPNGFCRGKKKAL